MHSLHGGGVGGAGQADQQLLLGPEPGQARMDQPGQQPQGGLWSGQIQQGFEHGLQPHQLQQLHHQQQQQLQHQLLLGGHGNLAPLVGQQISQLLGPGQQHQSPPGLGGPTLNMMLGGHHMSMAGQMFPGQPVQSPPSSNGQFLLLPGAQQQHRPGPAQGEGAVSPNSTPGLQTPTPSATPPIINFDNTRDNSLFMGNQGRFVTGQELEQAGEVEQAMALRGLQALQGGTLADMFPNMDRGGMGQFGGLERQMGPNGHHPGQMERSVGFPGSMPGNTGQGFNNYTVAMAQAAQAQAQDNMMRLQQLQQNQEFHPKHQVPAMHQFTQFQGPHMMAQADMSRPYHGFPPPQCQSPSPNGFSLPPGPRPRPVGGDSSPPGYTPDTLPSHLGEESTQSHTKDQEQQQQQLVIGSWNEECDKEAVSAPHTVVAPVVQNLSQPPPRHGQPDQEWGGTFHVPRGGGQHWGGGEFVSSEQKPGGRAGDFSQGHEGENNRGKRGGRGGRGASQRGRGSRSSDAEIIQEKAMGKNAAIEETKAMMAKMRLEEKEMLSKYKKEKGIPEEEVPEENKVQPGAYRPRERRGRDDRKDGQRGRGGRGRGRGGLPMPGPGGPVPPMFGLPPYVPGDFRTPPFPGMEGFLPPPGLGQFPPGFPPHFAPGFPPGIFPPGPFPGEMRGRGGFNRGRGFPPVGFPPRGFPPPMIGNRGGRGGRGGYQPVGREKEFRGEGDEDNPLLTAIEGNKEEIVENPETEVTEPEQESVPASDTATVLTTTNVVEVAAE